MRNREVFVFHVGARDNYSVAKYFHIKNSLKHLITDFWIQRDFKYFVPKNINSKIYRRSSNLLEKVRVFHYPFIYIIFYKLTENIFRNKFRIWEIKGRFFCHFVNSKIDQYSDKNEVILWGYTCGALEVFRKYKSNKKFIKILNQIDPGIEYYSVQKALSLSYPNLEEGYLELTESFRSRIAEEWELADIIIVNSNYSKKSLIKYGVPESKINVVPLIYSSDCQLKRTINWDRKLIIGFVGNINLIKGFLQFAESAKELFEKMEFRAIGRSWFKKDVIQDLSKYIVFYGHLSKDEMGKMYNEIDVLIFPSYSDGFGMVQLEAMANGIPVVSTKNCGEVVIHNENGFIMDSSKDLIEYLNKFNGDRELLEKFSLNCYERIKDFDFNSFDFNINQILDKTIPELYR